MSDTTPQNGNGAEPAIIREPTPAQSELSDDLLMKIIAASERAFTQRASRPSPIHLRTWEEIDRFAERAARSGMVAKDYINKPDAIVIAVMMGAELGLSPLQSLQNINVINGRPAVWGDAMLGLIKASGHLRDIQETLTGEGEDRFATCAAWRVGERLPVTRVFSVKDAVKAKLWGNNVWALYPDRMLQMRARSWSLRDAFPDVLRGLMAGEEARDIPWEDTGLPPLGAPPVATGEPIRSALSNWLTTVDAAIKAQKDAPGWMKVIISQLPHAPTQEDVLALAAQGRVQSLIKEAPEKPKALMEAAFAAALKRFDRAAEAEEARKWDEAAEEAQGPVDGGSAANEPTPPEAPLKDVLALEAERIIKLIKGAITTQQITQVCGSMVNAMAIENLKEKRPELFKQVEAARIKRGNELGGAS